ncbi:hypothetical protein B566_EDAN004912 [Ephemera danica]|nr:hypothetical protein B566_EDAN004912 [Ephemera danica]
MTRQRSNELDDLLYLNRGYTRAKAACESGHLHEALEIAQNVVDGRSEMLGHDHEDTKHARRLMAAILHSLGRHDEAKHMQVTPQTELCSNQQARNITIINHIIQN